MPIQIATGPGAAAQGRRVYVATGNNTATEAKHLYLAQGPDTFATLFTHPDAPTISAFSSTVTSVRTDLPNPPTTQLLRWTVTGATTIGLTETLADGTSRNITIPAGQSHVNEPVPGQDAVYTLTATNAAGQTSTGRVELRHESAARIVSFVNGGHTTAPGPGGLVLNTLILNWQVSGKPFPSLRLDSNDDHANGHDVNRATNRNTGNGTLRITHSYSPGQAIGQKYYRLWAQNSYANISAVVNFTWP